MRIYRIIFASICTFTVCCSATATGSNTSTALSISSITAPQMPTIIVPSMPTITIPSIDDDFYMPEQTKITTTTTDANGKVTTTTTGTGKETPATGTDTNTLPTTTVPDTKATSQLNSVTASDIKALDNLGLLGNVTSLIGTTGQTNSQSNILEQILTQLTQLKKQEPKQTSDSKVETTSLKKNTETETDTENSETNGSILRFIVNGYNIVGTCRTVYFSKKEQDGSFLLTGDRKYLSDGQTYSETFYLLFKSVGSTGGSTMYNVIPQISQTTKNPYSFLYKISQQKHLTAEKTGNLVTMHVTGPELQADLLLDIGS